MLEALLEVPSRIRDSGNYTSKKKAETLYTTVASNKKNDEIDNICVFLNTNGQRQLNSVGGFNCSSYDLLANISKGRQYTAGGGQGQLAARINGTVLSPDPSGSTKINDCITVDISSSAVFAYPDYTYNMYEGPFLFARDASFSNLDASNSIPFCACTPDTLSKMGFVIDPSSTISFPFGQIVAKESLRDFKYPGPFCIPDISSN